MAAATAAASEALAPPPLVTPFIRATVRSRKEEGTREERCDTRENKDMYVAQEQRLYALNERMTKRGQRRNRKGARGGKRQDEGQKGVECSRSGEGGVTASIDERSLVDT